MSGPALSLFFAVKNRTSAGSGRVILPQEVMERTNLRLGDPVFVDVSPSVIKPPMYSGKTNSFGWTFLATVEPRLVQHVCMPGGSCIPADKTAVLDPFIQLHHTKLPPVSETSVPSFVGRFRMINQKPIECSTAIISIRRLNKRSTALTVVSRLLQRCCIVPGATIHLAEEIVATVRTAEPPPTTPENDSCWYVTANTRVTIIDDSRDQRNYLESFSSRPLCEDSVLVGMDETLGTLREAIVWPYLHPDDAYQLGVEFPHGVLIHGPPGVGKSAAVRMVAAEMNANEHVLGGGDVFGPLAGDSEARLRHLFQAARDDIRNGNPTILMLDEIDTICPDRGNKIDLHGSRVVGQLLTLMDDGGYREQGGERLLGKCDERGNTKKDIFPSVVATTNRPNVIDSALRRPGRFDMEVEITLPCKQKREIILQLHSRSLSLSSKVDLKYIAEQAKGYSGADLAALCREATMAAIRRTRVVHDDGPSRHSICRRTSGYTVRQVSSDDFKLASSRTCASLVRGIKVELPNTRWNEIGGLCEIKYRLQKAVEWPLRHSVSFLRLGLTPPSGILLCGPPGCGKTTLAHAAATESKATVITLTVADTFHKFVGEGEQTLRDAFTRARRTAPSILLLDELDGMVSSRDSSSDSDDTNKSAHILSVLLTEMDGLDATSNGSVLVIATTNRFSSLDHALTRPGRFDVVLHISEPDATGRAEALRIHSKMIPLNTDVNLDDVAARTEHLTGAQLEGIVREATLVALRENIDNKQVAQRHFEAALMAII